MIKNRNIYVLAAVIISILSMVIITSCGDSTTTTPVVPTSTPTPSPVITVTPTTPPPTSTPTPVPTVKDVSDQFNISADYYVTGAQGATLVIQLYQKSTSNLSIKGFELLAADNLDFPFFGAIPSTGGFNSPPADWKTKSDLTLLQWQGTTPLTKGNIYSFNTGYPNTPNMPKTLKVTLTGGTVVVNTKTGAGAEDQVLKLGTLLVNIVTRIAPPTAVPVPSPSPNS
jgi:hypothetical protein